jgi:ketosteroid isomerase-like protein
MLQIGGEMDELTRETLRVVERLNEAVNGQDLDAVMGLMTQDCVFENTFPPPDGERFVGRAAVRGFWDDFFRSSPGAHFDFDEVVVYGERAFVRWRYAWENADGTQGHVRGVDLFWVKGGRVSEKLSYVKG